MEKEVNLNLPCLICSDDVPNPIEDDIIVILADLRSNVGSSKLSDDPIFQYFLQLFKVADFVGSNEAHDNFKFCGGCKNQVGNLLELQIKLDQLKKQIASGVENLKEKIEGNEGSFESKDIYNCNPSYKTIRSKVVENDLQEMSTSTTPKAQPTRRKKAVTVTKQQKLALKSILQSGPEVNWTASPLTLVLQPPVQNEPAQWQHPRQYIQFVEYPEKQLLVYGDFTFNLLEPSSEGGKRQVKCTLCDLIMPYSKGRIKGHLHKFHTESFKCSHCSTTYSRVQDLNTHILSVHEGQPKKLKMIECTICTKPISTGQRKKHEWSHKSKEEKEQALKDPALAAEIPQSFRNEKKFQCDLGCKELWFPSLALMKRHQNRRHRDPAERMEICPECGGSYLNLRAHMKIQHAKEDKDGVVDLMKTCLEPGCGRRFLNLGDLTRHKNQVHRKLKPFECADCGKCFGDKWNWKQHVKSHTIKVEVNVKVEEDSESE